MFLEWEMERGRINIHQERLSERKYYSFRNRRGYGQAYKHGEEMLTLINMLVSAILFRQRGTVIQRGLWLAIMTGLAYAYSQDVTQTLLWLWVFVVMGCFPTHVLFSAIHGNLPGRRDHWLFDWMQTIARRFKGKAVGVVYGAVRALPALPAFILLGKPAMAVLLLHGVVYYLWGLRGEVNAVRNSEFTIGAILGMFLVW